MFAFHKDFIDILSFKLLLGDLLIVWHTVFVQVVAQVLNIFKHNDLCFIVDTAKQSFKALSTLQSDGNLIVKEFCDKGDTHTNFNVNQAKETIQSLLKQIGIIEDNKGPVIIVMVYLPRINFKTGIFPSKLRTFPTDGNYTGTQKLMLTATRIFGTKIGGTMRSGIGPFRELRMSRQFLTQWRIDPNAMSRYWPSFVENEEADFKRASRLEWLDDREKKRARRKKK